MLEVDLTEMTIKEQDMLEVERTACCRPLFILEAIQSILYSLDKFTLHFLRDMLVIDQTFHAPSLCLSVPGSVGGTQLMLESVVASERTLFSAYSHWYRPRYMY